MKRPDVVVIGGGIVGCATAYFLAESGYQVHVVERAGISSGTSSACMGHLMLMTAPEPMYRLSRRSLDLWKQFHHDHGGFDYRPTGCLWLGESAEDLPLLETMHQEVLGFGDRGEILSPAELRRKEPSLAADLVGAFFYPEDAVVFPMQATAALLGAAVKRGATVQTRTSVTGLDRGPDGAVRGVLTNQGTIEADVVVNAAGVLAPEITEMAGLPRAPIFPRRGDLAITMPQDLRVKHQMVEVAYLRTATGKAPDPEKVGEDPGAYALNLQPQSNGTVLIGSTRQFAGYDRQVNMDLLQKSCQRAARFVPAVADLQIVRAWAGLRPYTKDKMPILGPVEGVPGLFMASGHEGLGITLSMATGELLAAAIRGEARREDVAPFVLDRFAETVDG